MYVGFVGIPSLIARKNILPNIFLGYFHTLILFPFLAVKLGSDLELCHITKLYWNLNVVYFNSSLKMINCLLSNVKFKSLVIYLSNFKALLFNQLLNVPENASCDTSHAFQGFSRELVVSWFPHVCLSVCLFFKSVSPFLWFVTLWQGRNSGEQSTPPTLLSGKFLLTYWEKRGKENPKRERGKYWWWKEEKLQNAFHAGKKNQEKWLCPPPRKIFLLCPAFWLTLSAAILGLPVHLCLLFEFVSPIYDSVTLFGHEAFPLIQHSHHSSLLSFQHWLSFNRNISCFHLSWQGSIAFALLCITILLYAGGHTSGITGGGQGGRVPPRDFWPGNFCWCIRKK